MTSLEMQLKCKEENNCKNSVIMCSFPEPASVHTLRGNFQKSIDLELKPNENVVLSLHFQWQEESVNQSRQLYYNNYSKPSHLYCKYELTFQNNLHEACNDYWYNLSIQFLVRNQGNLPEHIHVLFKANCRTANKIYGCKFEKIYEMSIFTSIVHICCDIQRYKKKGDEILNQHFQDNVGMMLLKTGIYSDISFVFEDDIIIKAHKDILVSKSEVFNAMFYHKMFESETGVVKIVDFDFEIFKSMLEYIYTGKTNINGVNSYELFQIANKYKISDLQSECEEYFLFNLDLQNIVNILYLGDFWETPEFNKYLMSFIKNNEAKIVKDVSYQKYLCTNLNFITFFSTLELYAKYDLQDLKPKLLDFVKIHNNELINNPEFLILFNTHSDFMREAYIHCITK